MRQETSIRAIQSRGFGTIAAAALTAAVVLIAAGPARARNEFENAFEDQLGRIAAYGAVNLGLQILTGGYYPAVVPVPVVAPVYYGPSYYAPSYGAYYGPYYGPRKVVVRYPTAYRHGRHWGSHNRYYGNQYGYYDDDRGHRSHGKQHGKHHGKRHGKGHGNGHGRNW